MYSCHFGNSYVYLYKMYKKQAKLYTITVHIHFFQYLAFFCILEFNIDIVYYR